MHRVAEAMSVTSFLLLMQLNVNGLRFESRSLAIVSDFQNTTGKIRIMKE